MELFIKNAFLTEESWADFADVLVKDGKIAAIGHNLPCAGEVIDAGSLTLLPAFVDLHCHFRDPGYTYKENMESGCRAAAKGGYTAVNLMANTNPVCSDMETVRYVRQKAEQIGLAEVHQCVSVTKDFDGRTVEHLKELDDTVRLISEDGKGVMSNLIMARAMEIAKEKGLIVLSHAEDMELSSTDYRLAENIATVQHIHLSQYLGARLHMCHVSTKEAMEEIIRAKRAGAPVTCEVAPHHLWFCDTDYRVNPPIRTREDREFLIQAIQNGFVDAIATDHAPHTQEDKRNGAPGMVGLETAFSVCYTRLVKERGLPLTLLSRLLSAAPARILGLNKGRLLPGYDADFALVDEKREWKVQAANFASKGKNSPFDGIWLQGKVVRTIKAGKTTWRE
ncbi:MAG: dihydroorotase [Oscillospiraceae bacterium]|nr:dihydroorotase [Oscillospiraceae bacterium]